MWRHVIVSARCNWLHGDPRGFRSREHRIHSSGDYKSPPPPGEHAGLWRYHQRRSRDPVRIDFEFRAEIVRSFVLKLRKLQLSVITVSISRKHLHALVDLPSNPREARKEIGKCKQASSLECRIEGRVWSEGGKYEPIRDKAHLHNTYHYIRGKQERGTVVWSHRPDENWIDNDVPIKVM